MVRRLYKTPTRSTDHKKYRLIGERVIGRRNGLLTFFAGGAPSGLPICSASALRPSLMAGSLAEGRFDEAPAIRPCPTASPSSPEQVMAGEPKAWPNVL